MMKKAEIESEHVESKSVMDDNKARPFDAMY